MCRKTVVAQNSWRYFKDYSSSLTFYLWRKKSETISFFYFLLFFDNILTGGWVHHRTSDGHEKFEFSVELGVFLWIAYVGSSSCKQAPLLTARGTVQLWKKDRKWRGEWGQGEPIREEMTWSQLGFWSLSITIQEPILKRWPRSLPRAIKE